MKKIFFAIIFILFDILMIYPQDKVDAEFQNYISKYETFNFDSLLAKKFDNFLKIEGMSMRNSKSLGEREIDFNLKQSKFEFYFPYAEENSIRWRKYILHVFENPTKIIGIICIDVYSPRPDSIRLYCNEIELNKYIANHDSLYSTKTTKYDFIKEFAMNETYGYCQGDGIIIDMKDKLERVGVGFGSYPNPVDKFRKWLRSYNIELQTFAIDALDMIYQGTYFDSFEEAKKNKEKDLQIIKYIKERNLKVWKCDSHHSPELIRVF